MELLTTAAQCGRERGRGTASRQEGRERRTRRRAGTEGRRRACKGGEDIVSLEAEEGRE